MSIAPNHYKRHEGDYTSRKYLPGLSEARAHNRQQRSWQTCSWMDEPAISPACLRCKTCFIHTQSKVHSHRGPEMMQTPVLLEVVCTQNTIAALIDLRHLMTSGCHLLSTPWVHRLTRNKFILHMCPQMHDSRIQYRVWKLKIEVRAYLFKFWFNWYTSFHDQNTLRLKAQHENSLHIAQLLQKWQRPIQKITTFCSTRFKDPHHRTSCERRTIWSSI